ncbi:MAG: RNA polymerase sigma factor [Planctomycetota bacterium]
MTELPEVAREAPDAAAGPILALSGPAWRLALHMLGSPHSAEDAVQQAYLEAVNSLRSGPPPRELRAWFLGIVANEARDHLRREARRHRKEAEVSARAERTPAVEADRELHGALRQEVGRLEQKYRLPLVLCHQEGLSQAEVAAVLSMPASTVSKYVNAGLEKLREALGRLGYAASPAALILGLKQSIPSAPAGLVATLQKLTAGGTAAKATATAGSLTLGWKLVAGVSAAVLLGAGSVGAWRQLAPRPPAAAPPVSASAGVKAISLLDDVEGPLVSDGTLRIRGARNGVFSGKVVAPWGSRASVPELSGPGKLPASSIAVRYGHPDMEARYHRSRPKFNGLHPEPSAPMTPSKYYKPHTTQPVWLTVRVPADSKPGKYTGTWSVGGSAVKVELSVADWRVPDVGSWVTHAGFIQSPDSVAMHYNVPMWSEEHWKLIEESFKLLGEVGNGSLYIPLQRRTHFGNPHSMVHWTRNGEKLEPDLSIVKRYIDLAVKHMDKLSVVCLYAWEMDCEDAKSFPSSTPAADRQKDREILITVKNGGKLEEAKGPKWGTPECAAFWKPVFTGIHGMLERHGLGKSMMLGLSGDYVPSPKAAKDLASAAPPGTKWVCHAHGSPNKVHEADAGLTASVWGFKGPVDPDAPPRYDFMKPRYYGWQRKKGWLLTAYPRYGCFYGNALNPFSPGALAMYRSAAEGAMTAVGRPKRSPGVNGFDRLGTDFWLVLKDKRGRGSPLCGRYPECHWGQLKISTATAAILAPGKKGAVATERFEMLREGLQETEARVFIERALVGKKISGEPAARLQKMLDDRTKEFLKASKSKGSKWQGWVQWTGGDRWQKSSAALYAGAAEVAKKTGAK